jgi:hypothetical protein
VQTPNPPIAHGWPRENRLFRLSLHRAADGRSMVPNLIVASWRTPTTPGLRRSSHGQLLVFVRRPQPLRPVQRPHASAAFDCASCAWRTGESFAALTQARCVHSKGARCRVATFNKRRSCAAPMSRHASTMELEHPGARHGLPLESALSSMPIGCESWSSPCPSALAPAGCGQM